MRNGNGEMSERALSRDADAAERQALIEQYLPLVRRIARRFDGRDEAFEDLAQVGALALVKAVDRRDPERRGLLTAYVSRCVEGEIRRHLRDRTGVVRVPRRLQPSDRPVALGWEERDGDATAPDDELDGVAVARALVSSAARTLEARERRVLALRFFLDLSQAQVGRVEGVSQVQVSRLQRTALAKMRARLMGDELVTPHPGLE